MNNQEKNFQESNIDPEKLSQSINDFVNGADDGQKGNAKRYTKIARIEEFINRHYEIRLNQVLNVLEVKKLDDINSEFEKAEKFEFNIVVELMREGMSGVQNIVVTLLRSDFVKEYHPIQDYFLNLRAWDGRDRITEMASSLRCYNQEQSKALKIMLEKQLVRCVASAFKTNYFNKHCFVLVGTRQSMGKTTFIRKLLPVKLSAYITDAVLNWEDKDANIALGSNWIINIDELANLNKQNSNNLKATLSRDKIKIRRPYGKIDSEIARLANFFGSTNDLQFLSDLTGNVRWICFQIVEIDKSYFNLDLDQVWAQSYYQFTNGFDFELTQSEIFENEERNKAFLLPNAEVDAINTYLIPFDKNDPFLNEEQIKFGTASDIMKLLNSKECKLTSPIKLGKALQACGFEKCSVRAKDRVNAVWGYKYIECEINFES